MLSKLTVGFPIILLKFLNKAFLSQYAGAMDKADIPVVYFNPSTLEHKKLPPISAEEVKNAFANNDLKVFTDTSQLQEFLLEQNWQNMNLLLMSSGNFGGMNYNELSKTILDK